MRRGFTFTEGAPYAGAPTDAARDGMANASGGAVRPVPAPDVRPRVSASLAPRERGPVAAVAGGAATLAHRETLTEVAEDVAHGRADAVLVSAARLTAADRRALSACVRGHPAVAFAGIVTAEADERRALVAAHLLGEAGVPALLDCRGPGGWTALRGAFAPRRLADAFRRACVASVLAEVWGDDAIRRAERGPEYAGLARFFALAFVPGETQARRVAARLGVCAPTLVCRFYRDGLPSPKQYVDGARLVWAAHLGEAPGLTVQAVADQVNASAPQAFARSVRRLTGQSVGAFRRAHTRAEMLTRFRAALVAPYRDQLRTCDPLAPATGGRRCPDRAPTPEFRRAA